MKDTSDRSSKRPREQEASELRAEFANALPLSSDDEGSADEGDEELEEDDLDLGSNPWNMVFSLLAAEEDDAVDEFEDAATKGEVPAAVAEVIPNEELQVFALAFFDAQLAEGGLAQFVYQCKCETIALNYTVACLKKIKAPKHAELLAKTVSILSECTPEDVESWIEEEFDDDDDMSDKLDQHTEAIAALRATGSDDSPATEDIAEKIATLAKAVGFVDDEN